MFKFLSQFFNVWNKYCCIYRLLFCVFISKAVLMHIKIGSKPCNNKDIETSNKVKFFLENLMRGKLSLYILNTVTISSLWYNSSRHMGPLNCNFWDLENLTFNILLVLMIKNLENLLTTITPAIDWKQTDRPNVMTSTTLTVITDGLCK